VAEALIQIFPKHLRPSVNTEAAGAEIAFRLRRAGAGAIAVDVHAVDKFSSMPVYRRLRVIRTAKPLRLRVKELGTFASHAIEWQFDDETRLVLPVPLLRGTRQLLELLAIQDLNATAFRVDQGLAKLFRSLLPTRIKETTFSQIFRENLPRVQAESKSFLTSARGAAPIELLTKDQSCVNQIRPPSPIRALR
jgi:hypothetical protein